MEEGNMIAWEPEPPFQVHSYEPVSITVFFCSHVHLYGVVSIFPIPSHFFRNVKYNVYAEKDIRHFSETLQFKKQNLISIAETTVSPSRLGPSPPHWE